MTPSGPLDASPSNRVPWYVARQNDFGPVPQQPKKATKKYRKNDPPRTLISSTRSNGPPLNSSGSKLGLSRAW
jgi:hypothetical protein